MAPSEQERRIARVIEEYDLQGWHRSGTEVDGASARWLADRVPGRRPATLMRAARARTWLSMPAAASALGSSSRQRVRPPRPAT